MRSAASTIMLLLCAGTLPSKADVQAAAVARSANLEMRFDASGRTVLIAHFGTKSISIGRAEIPESVVVDGHRLESWRVEKSESTSYSDQRGAAQRLVLIERSGEIEKQETVDAFERYGRMLVINVRYLNRSGHAVHISSWRNAAYTISAGDRKNGTAFWSLQSGSYEKRPDWVVPLKPGFAQENYLGMNADDYGGGTPVVDVWRPDVGLAVGHDELTPQLVSEPVAMPSADHATLAIEAKENVTLRPGAVFRTPETFVAVHQGDYFDVLRDYRRMMIDRGVQFETPAAGAFEPIWCAWGFGRNFQPEQIENAIPEAKRLGFGWVTMDDGWQTAEGDWEPNPRKFPRGDADVRALVDRIHAAGMKAQLWWAPLSVSPKSELIRAHPEWLLLDPSGSRRRISWWNAFYLCPADADVVAYHRRLAERIFKTWGFDGLKLDGQFLNAVPRCTNPAHHHASELDSVRELPFFFRAISDAAHAVKPGALIELCPCGTAYSFFAMPYYNMSVASDPESSWQVRSKGKTLKALMGDKLPYFGDHVELSDGGMDFASTVGVGGVIGTEYRWPPNDKAAPPSDADAAKLILTPEKETLWAKWVRIYRKEMLPEGEYLGNLYDIGFDKPETHCIRKNGVMYYAFFAPEWKGTVELRGLGTGRYAVFDYVDNKPLGFVNGPDGKLQVAFKGSLLIAVQADGTRGPNDRK
ncbi:MAG TPA: glycoside hydrolase family 36 protein [Bryobacteraceae bacterium]|nr:glycoside hydrolase family 36 protein [Bryobacteraceae bacterium]